MSWSEWPHSVSVQTNTQSPDDDGVLGDPVLGDAVSVTVQIETSTRVESLTLYGIEAGFGAVLRCEMSDGAYFTPQSEVTYKGALYTVRSAMAPQDDDILGYAEFALERQKI